MKTATVKALICLVILLIVGTLMIGCGGGAKETATSSHFAENGIAFDYSSNWKILKSDDPTRIAYLSEVGTSTIIQVIKEATSGFELKTYHDNLAIVMMTGEPVSGRSLTVAGLSAYETVFNLKKDTTSFRMRLVSLEKDDYFYDMVFSTTPGNFDKVNKNFETVVSSFEVE